MKFLIVIMVILNFLAPTMEAKRIKSNLSIKKENNIEKEKKPSFLKRKKIDLNYSILSSDIENISFKEIIFSGYDKEVNSSQESFLMTNPSDKTIIGIEVRIDYLDLENRLFHSRNISEQCEIPPFETRRIDIKSWDSQHTYYYYLGNEPKKIATPFKVKFTPVFVWVDGTEE